MFVRHLTSSPINLSANMDVVNTKAIKSPKPITASLIQFCCVESFPTKYAWTSHPGIAVYWSIAKANASSINWSITVETTCIDVLCHCTDSMVPFFLLSLQAKTIISSQNNLLLSLGWARSNVALWSPYQDLQNSTGYAKWRNIRHIFSICHQPPME